MEVLFYLNFRKPSQDYLSLDSKGLGLYVDAMHLFDNLYEKYWPEEADKVDKYDFEDTVVTERG